MNALKGLIWTSSGFCLLFGALASVVFEPQYQPAAYVLIVGGVFFMALGIAADQFR